MTLSLVVSATVVHQQMVTGTIVPANVLKGQCGVGDKSRSYNKELKKQDDISKRNYRELRIASVASLATILILQMFCHISSSGTK